MRKIFLCGLLAVFAASAPASASTWINNYKDIKRVGGHKRSSAAFKADLRFCAQQTGLPYNNQANDLAIDQPDPPAFKACMLGRGLRWRSTVRNYQAPARSSWPGWEVRINDPRDVGTTNNDPPPSPVAPPPMIDTPQVDMSQSNPAINPGYFQNLDDQQSNW